MTSNQSPLITRFRNKHGSNLWDSLYNHPEGIAIAADFALGDLSKVIDTNPSLSLDKQFIIFTEKFITRGNRTNKGDYLQNYNSSQISKLVDDCFEDFTLLVFCLLLLSQPNVRNVYSKGSSKDLELYLDLIYSKTAFYHKTEINPIPFEQRYLIAESLAGELT